MTDFLVIDSSERNFKLALFHKGKREFIVSLASADTSVSLLAAVEELIQRGGAKLSDIGVLGCVVGPGSFTGCRIGVATVKGLAFGRDTKLVAVNSLELAAYNVSATRGVMSIVPCVGGWYYAAVYSSGVEVSAPKAYRKEDLERLIADGGFVLAGKSGDFDSAAGRVERSHQDGAAYFAIMEERILRGGFCADAELLPLYLRKSQAEEARENGL